MDVQIRNFSIIAHIDHGKSRLADRILRMTGTIRDRGSSDPASPIGGNSSGSGSSSSSANKRLINERGEAQFSDKLEVERERGITVKAQTCAIFYKHNGETYLLNLIDTPGHVDFSYEVSRSLSACQAVLLLVDSSQGIEAQTLAHYYTAIDLNLVIIPIMTKIDQETSQPEVVKKEMVETFGVLEDEVLAISAKTGENCDQILPALIERVDPPSGDRDAPLKALIFDSWFDGYFGVVCLVYIAQGTLRSGDQVAMHSTFKHNDAKPGKMANMRRLQDHNMYEITGLGILQPDERSCHALYAGQVGYFSCGMKSTKEAEIGDTVFKPAEVYPKAFTTRYSSSASSSSEDQEEVAVFEALPGFKPSQPMVFAGFYPVDSENFERLRDALDKLVLNDSSVTVSRESSAALGMGFRCGFLGLLHMDVFKQRLEQEFDSEVIITAPTVPYQVTLADTNETIIVDNPNQFPEDYQVKFSSICEPMVDATILLPTDYIGSVMKLCQDKRGEQTDMSFLSDTRAQMQYRMPLSEILHDFFDTLKSITRGFASLEYEDAGFQPADLVKMTISLNGDPVDAMSLIVHRSKAYRRGRDLVERLREVIDRQLFEIAIQASVGNKVIASERLRAYRKNVTAKCYGGDVTRKKKLLEAQKRGKKRMKQIGSVSVPQEAFLEVFSERGPSDK